MSLFPNIYKSFKEKKGFSPRIYVFIFGISVFGIISLNAKDVSKINSKRLKIVTWNIQMLPNSFAFFSNSLRKKQRLRAPWIIDFCINQDYDIIVFQEVFDKKIKKKLKKELSNLYPYQVDPLRKRWSCINNGILIISRVPMKYVDHVFFEKGAHTDKLASKGCTLVEIIIDNIKIQIAGTHLQAGESRIDILHRNQQFQKIHNLLSRNKFSSKPVFLLGDMNTRKSEQIEYSKMLDVIGIRDYTLDDNSPYTIDSNNYWNNHSKPAQLDYILLQPRQTSTKIINQTIIRPKQNHKGVKIDLADHYGIVAEIEVLNSI